MLSLSDLIVGNAVRPRHPPGRMVWLSAPTAQPLTQDAVDHLMTALPGPRLALHFWQGGAEQWTSQRRSSSQWSSASCCGVPSSSSISGAERLVDIHGSHGGNRAATPILDRTLDSGRLDLAQTMRAALVTDGILSCQRGAFRGSGRRRAVPVHATRAGSDSPPAGRRRFHAFGLKRLQLSFSKPLHAAISDHACAHSRTAAFRNLLLENCRLLLPATRSISARVPQRLFLRRSAAFRDRICFAIADQRSWLVALRRAQRW